MQSCMSSMFSGGGGLIAGGGWVGVCVGGLDRHSHGACGVDTKIDGSFSKVTRSGHPSNLSAAKEWVKHLFPVDQVWSSQNNACSGL